MGKVELYKNIIDEQEMSLIISKHNKKISECEIFEEKEFAFIGISLGNSYFTEKRLELILKAFSKNFKRVAILLVDDIAEHNFRSMGYNEKKIKKKIKENSNYMQNRINRCIVKTNKKYERDNIELFTWKDIENYDKYHVYLEKVTSLYENNSVFKESIYSVTKDVIEKYLNISDSKDLIEESKWYLLKELALSVILNDFFDEKSILTCYYQDFELYREFLKANHFNISSEINHDCLIYHCKTLE